MFRLGWRANLLIGTFRGRLLRGPPHYKLVLISKRKKSVKQKDCQMSL